MTPDAIGPLLAMQQATNIHDAHEHAVDAVKAGASGEEVRQAINEWMQLQARQVQTVFAGHPKRPGCCTGIERDHKEIAAAMDRHPSGKDLPPYTHKPITTVGGLRVVGWSSPTPVVDEGPDHIAPEDRCTECAGWGGWTETVEGADGSDVDVDYDCSACGATGVEP